MIKNGVKYGMMNGVKWHPLGPSFADDVAGLNRWLLTTGAPCGARKLSTAAASSSPTWVLCTLQADKTATGSFAHTEPSRMRFENA